MAAFAGHLLAFDTSAAHCAAALVLHGGQDENTGFPRHEAMATGQADRLIPLLAEVLAEAGLGWRDLSALAVGIGPGNFTGVRIAVAAARGLSLGLGVPAIGVSGFEAVRAADSPGAHPAELISLPAPHDKACVQHFSHGRPLAPPRLIDPAAPPADLAADLAVPRILRVRGYRAKDIAAAFGAEASEATPGDIAARIAAVALWRLAGGEAPQRPAPLYVRPADAAPPADPPPVIIDAVAP